MEEHNRLLYVALTRAEDRLLVCGWQGAHAPKDECWHNLVRRGFEAAGAEAEAVRAVGGRGAAVALAAVASRRDRRAGGEDGPRCAICPDGSARRPTGLPAPPPPEPPRPLPLAPSRPEGVELGTVPAADSPLAERDAGGNRFRRGQLIHSLLQHLPSVPAAARRAAAMRFLDKPGHGLPAGEAERVADEVLAVIAHPDLAPLFGPDGRAEVPLTGVIGDAVVGGLVDRLAVLPGSRAGRGLQDQPPPACPRRGYAGDVSAADGVLSGGAADDFPWPARALCFDLDARGEGGDPAG